MKILVTGSPGVGKTTFAKELAKRLKCNVINEKDLSLKFGLGEFNSANELEIPLPKFKKALNLFLADFSSKKNDEKNKKSVVMEGHVVCEVKADFDFVVLLTLPPDELEMRLELRGYSPEKIMDNVFCEGIDYCKKYVYRNNKKSKIIELISKESPKILVEKVIKKLK
jgi:adenylate kinase